ncbi:hypothetical protein LEP1GSC116_0951 [Leptospira interrogans serovar Icterohaemorrhagiae str. Verdun HP]|uniref:Uncharacterized protein n=1 Tax=Leptospira interrogans serovar Icterohaemorrhagiae str. Verdun HP TaxID=1049910 RepID=M6RUR5_LEPIR|nr:hypothetical protein LEP1GSC116_0951 [Leptospira interrogans serovar Icterohaemorrhagiae str. Verdun HP]
MVKKSRTQLEQILSFLKTHSNKVEIQTLFFRTCHRRSR